MISERWEEPAERTFQTEGTTGAKVQGRNGLARQRQAKGAVVASGQQSEEWFLFFILLRDKFNIMT